MVGTVGKGGENEVEEKEDEEQAGLQKWVEGG